MSDLEKINKDFSNLYTSGKALLEKGVNTCMNVEREKAFSSFLEGGIPTKKVEDYKYTDLSASFEKDYNVVLRYHKQDVELNDVFKCDVPELDTSLVLTTNGWYYERNKELSGLALSQTMLNYSGIGEEYLSILKIVIKKNKLETYDKKLYQEIKK